MVSVIKKTVLASLVVSKCVINVILNGLVSLVLRPILHLSGSQKPCFLLSLNSCLTEKPCQLSTSTSLH